MMANEVTNRDIAQLSDDIVAGRIGGKGSLSNARHVRKGASGLFKWAAQPSRAYVDRSGRAASAPAWASPRRALVMAGFDP